MYGLGFKSCTNLNNTNGIHNAWGTHLVDSSDTRIEDFLSSVRDDKSHVYAEYDWSGIKTLRMLLPLLCSFAITLLGVYVMWVYPAVIPDNPWLRLTILFGPIAIGTGYSFRYLLSQNKMVKDYEMRGVNRLQLGAAISFLDMIHEGCAEVGKIIEPKKPEEYIELPTAAYGSALIVLGKIDSEMKTRWSTLLREKISPHVSLWLKTFIRLTVYGSMAILAVYVIASILRLLGLLGPNLFFLILGVSVVILIVFVILLGVYVYIMRDAAPPTGVVEAISEPDIRMKTGLALDLVIETILSEGKHPLRLLVIGEHSELLYTGRTFRTSKDVTLREAVLIPRYLKKSSDF